MPVRKTLYLLKLIPLALFFPNKAPGKSNPSPIKLDIGEILVLYKYNVTPKTWVAKYKGVLGTVQDSIIGLTPAFVSLRSGIIHKDAMIKKYGRLYGTDICNGTIRQGMNKAMVEEVYGKPNDINRTVGDWGVHEQWVYGDGLHGKTEYLYFENGKLTSWQD